MLRLHILLPDQACCKAVVSRLGASGVPRHHMHVLARLAERLEELPEAGVWEKTELAHGIERGIGLGGAAGLIGGLLAVTFPPAGLVLGGGALLAGAAAGAGIGAAVNALLGSHEHSHDLDRYQRGIANGHILLMVDVHHAEQEEVEALIRDQYPEADIGVAAKP